MATVSGMCSRKVLQSCHYLQVRNIVAQCSDSHARTIFSSRRGGPSHPAFSRGLFIRSDMSGGFITQTRCLSSTAFVSKMITSDILDSVAVRPHHTCFIRPYSSHKNEGSDQQVVDGLAQDLLQNKMGANQMPGTNDSSTSGSGGKEQSKDKKDSWFSGKHAWKLGVLSLVGMTGLMAGQLLYLWGRPIMDPDGNEIPDEFSELPVWKAYIKRTLMEAKFFKKMIEDPSSRKLLPDPLKEPYYQPPYTLVLEMTGVLVHPDWTLSTGWRFKKRPGIQYFLQQVGPPMFEVVIYTHEQGLTAFPILEQLDPNGFISYRLFRDATKYQDGHHLKDLGCLNRDLSKVILVDWDSNAAKLHLRNAVNMDKWKGQDEDKGLYDLAAFLTTIAHSGVEDVREVLDYYNQFDNPLEAFKENQRRLVEEQERKVTDKPQDQKSLASNFSSGLMGRRR